MAGRIGVVVAGDVYANPSLVRPFLEDDGYRVDAEVFDEAELLPAVFGAMPDALVVDEGLLADRPHALEDIRLVSPGTKVVVIGAAGAGGNGAPAPDAHLAPGVSLATMSVTIGRLVGNGHLGPSDGDADSRERSAGGLVTSGPGRTSRARQSAKASAAPISRDSAIPSSRPRTSDSSSR